MNNEPIRHHYIPQFLIRNFCFNDRGEVHYYNLKTGSWEIRKTTDIFMERNLYRDEINRPDNPTEAEHSFSAFENEMAHLIKERFLQEKIIELSKSEYDKKKSVDILTSQ